MLQITLLILHNKGNSIHIYIVELIRREVFYIWSHVSPNVQETDSAECVWANLMHSKPCDIGWKGNWGDIGNNEHQREIWSLYYLRKNQWWNVSDGGSRSGDRKTGHYYYYPYYE